MPRLVLASTSKYRASLLARLGLEPERIAPLVDEAPLMSSGLTAQEIAGALAREKALAVASRAPDAFVLGGDQLVEHRGAILGKPGSHGAASAQLARLSGSEHRLVTAIALVHPSGAIDEALDVHRLQMRALSPEEIERVLAADRPYDCAGSYRIESRGILLFDAIEGEDFTAIEGLPLIALGRILRRAGFSLP